MCIRDRQSTTTDLVPETASERTLDYRDTAGHRTALTLTEDARTCLLYTSRCV